MQFERGKPPETPNAPYRAARIKDERWRLAGSGFEPGRAVPRLSFTSSQDDMVSFSCTCVVQVSALDFPCQHTRGRASAALCDACAAF
jgi:hypothetical protein